MTETSPAAVSDITVEKTEHIKGIAVILLMWHHLFGIVDSVSWVSPLKGLDIIIGSSAKICIALFLFCSGYGLYHSFISKERPPKSYILKKAVKTVIPYWISMLVAIICLAILGRFDPKYLLNNVFCWILDENLYVSFAWYIKIYLLLLLVLPLIRMIESKWKKNILIDTVIYIVLPFIIYYFFQDYMDESQFISITHTLFSSFLFFIFLFPLFSIGIIFAKYGLYNKIRKLSEKIPKAIIITISVLICGYVIYLRYLFFYNCISDVAYGTFFTISAMLIFDNSKIKSRYVIPYLGRKSISYWLLSSMFFQNTKELQFLITWPHLSVLILIWTLVLLTPFVFCCDWISNKLFKLLFRE